MSSRNKKPRTETSDAGLLEEFEHLDHSINPVSGNLTRQMKITIEEAKARLPLNTLARQLRIAGVIPDRDGQTVPCFWPDRHANGDRNPSFNFYNGLTRFKCFGCGLSGDGIDLISLILGISAEESTARFVHLVGGMPRRNENRPTRPKHLAIPQDLSKGTQTDWMKVAEIRQLHLEAVSLAVETGVLRFGTVKGFRSWIVTDAARKIGEARRLDGEPFPSDGKLAERKAHTLAGSDKSWPVGIRPIHPYPESFDRIVLVEGGPDLLAAYHFVRMAGELTTLPVAMLGRNCRQIHPEALPSFCGRRIRIFPHADPDQGGFEAARHWRQQIENADAGIVDWFDFNGLIRRDGKPVKDLNDCSVIRAEDELELEDLLP